MKIKIGQKVKVKKDISDHSDYWDGCSSCKAEYLIITDITNITNSNYYWWDAYDKDNKEISYCCGHNLTKNDFIPYERTIDDVEEGDLIGNGTDFRRVFARTGQLIAFSSCWEKGQEEDTDFDYWQKISHFKNVTTPS
jgi:hypothetical protein